MSPDTCEGCGREVSVAGGIANVWSFGGRKTSAMTLELADGTEHYLCFDCVDELDDDPTEADVAALPERPRDEPVGSGTDGDQTPGSALGLWVVLGAVVGTAFGASASGPIEPYLTTGAAIGIGIALLIGKLRDR